MIKKQTKIVATISDRMCDVDFLQSLYENGINVVRLNTAHQGPDDTLKVVNNVRKVSDKIALLVDTKGPEVRTVGIEEPLEVEEGETVYITPDTVDGKSFNVSYDNFVNDVPVGSTVLIDDGDVGFEVTGKEGNALVCKTLNSGAVKKKKSVNVPDVHIDLPSLTEKDRNYVLFAIEHKLDFIAHSFVRNKKDILDIQAILDEHGSDAKIIAKIENREGVNNLDEILDVAYGVMVARGDLGIEIPAQEVPVIQKQMIEKCVKRAKPVITATQMLHTMIENPRPTRAEVSDVANAIYDGTDAVMLSGESAYGKYPLEAVKTMSAIALEVEKSKPALREQPVFEGENKVRNYLAKAAVSATNDLPVKAMVIDTETGLSARIVSSYRSDIPVHVRCHSDRVARELALSYGLYPSVGEHEASTDNIVKAAVKSLKENGDLQGDDLVVLLAGAPKSKSSNLIEIATVDEALS